MGVDRLGINEKSHLFVTHVVAVFRGVHNQQLTKS